jgi:hypothetical protein
MRVFVAWEVPEALRNALLRHLHEFNVAHPASSFEAFVQSTSTVPVAEMLREPALSVAQVLQREPRDGPQASAFERAMAEIEANPDLSLRAIAKRIGVSHQTVMRAQAASKGKSRRKPVHVTV